MSRLTSSLHLLTLVVFRASDDEMYQGTSMPSCCNGRLITAVADGLSRGAVRLCLEEGIVLMTARRCWGRAGRQFELTGSSLRRREKTSILVRFS